jgi:uncharacterized protein DUF885
MLSDMPATRIGILAMCAAMAAAGGSGPAAPPKGETVSGGYEELVSLFREWREFQRPPVREGVPDYTAAAMAEQKRRLPDFQRRLQALDHRAWPVAQQVDWHLVRAEMNGLDFEHRVLRPWSRDPGFYAVVIAEQSDTPSKEGRVFAGAIETWRLSFPLSAPDQAAFAAQLRAIPQALAQARANLVEDARDLWLSGIRVHREQGTLLADLAKQVAPHHPELVADVERARAAEDEFRAWLESSLPGKRGPSGVGVANYDWYLRHVHLSPYTWRDEVALHERELERALAHLRLEQAANAAEPPLRPMDTAEEWQRGMQEAVSAYLRFLSERGVGTVKDYMDPALRVRVSGFVPPERRDFFSQVDAREPLLLRCHGYHWFDLARMEKEPSASPIRRGPLLYNIWDSRAEGLATAMEEMMSSAGLFASRPRGREMMYVMLAQRAARGLASLRVHAHEIGLEEAVLFAHERTPYGWLKAEGSLVWFEQGLYLAQPGYGTCYLSGKAQIERLLADQSRRQGESFALRRFMDDLNGAGLIPVSLIRWELTGLDDEVKRLEQP